MNIAENGIYLNLGLKKGEAAFFFSPPGDGDRR